jgi:hypothetical protein
MRPPSQMISLLSVDHGFSCAVGEETGVTSKKWITWLHFHYSILSFYYVLQFYSYSIFPATGFNILLIKFKDGIRHYVCGVLHHKKSALTPLRQRE